MKHNRFRYLLLLVCGALAMGQLTSCHLDEPEPIPTEELFLRAFIKEYGLIDPEQDWNMATRSTVTINTGSKKAGLINVYVLIGSNYYRVAAYADVEGTVEIPIDVPDSSSKLYVDIDGKIYSTTVGGTLNLDAPSRSGSRDEENYRSQLSTQTWNDDRGWKNMYNPTTYTGEYITYDYFYLPNQGSTVNWDHPSHTDNTHFSLSEGASAYMMVRNPENKSNQHYKFTFQTQVSSETKLYIDFGMNSAYYPADVKQVITLNGTQSHTILLPYFPSGWIGVGLYVVSGNLSSIGNISMVEYNYPDMSWLLVAEDLGATDDFDFNDVIIQIKSLTVNEAYLSIASEHWQVIEDEDEHLVLTKAPKRPAQSRANVSYTELKISAMCAGGILDSYLHFRDNNGSDYVLKPGDWNLQDGPWPPLSTASTSETDACEWHKWFEDPTPINVVNHRNVLWTGLNDNITSLTATLVVPSSFSMSTYSQIFSDEDGAKDHIGDNGSINSPLYDDPNRLSPWSEPHKYAIRGFYLTVGKANGVAQAGETCYYLGASQRGGAPQMFLIPDVGTNVATGSSYGGSYWHWPRERVPILRVYPRFTDWVNNHLNSDWYLDPPSTDRVLDKEGEFRVKPYINRDR